VRPDLPPLACRRGQAQGHDRESLPAAVDSVLPAGDTADRNQESPVPMQAHDLTLGDQQNIKASPPLSGLAGERRSGRLRLYS